MNKSIFEARPTSQEAPDICVTHLAEPSRAKSGSLSISRIESHDLKWNLQKVCPLLDLPPTPPIFEGPLLKYKPGIGREFISRWCVLTRTSFCCYKSLDGARLCRRVLFAIPIDKISSFQSVTYHWVSEKHLFEVYLKHEDPMLGVSRETHQSAIDKSVLAGTYAYDHKLATEPGKLMKKPLRTPFNESIGKATQRNGWSFREIEWYSSEKRLLFAADSVQTRLQWLNAFSQAKLP